MAWNVAGSYFESCSCDAPLTISKAKRAKVNAFGNVFDGDSGFSNSGFAWSA